MATTLVWLVVFLHVWFCVLESFLWARPFGRKLMHISAHEAESTKVLALNQGLYNLMVALYLGWSQMKQDQNMTAFILVTIVFAGIVGAVSAKRKSFFSFNQFRPSLH